MKKILLITGLIIIGFSSLVDAECAWVLWEREHIKNEEGKVTNAGDWGIVSAYPKYEQCLDRQRQEFINFPEEQGYKVVSRPFEYALRYKEGGEGSILQELKCLPDTIDPRK